MISIIIPLYNQEKLIKATLGSILGQVYKNLEVMVVDDGSKDRGFEAAADMRAEFIKEKIRFEVIKQENKGAPAARNAGFRLSRGEYLFFCDADAILEPRALQKMIEAMNNHPEASYVFSSFLWGSKLFKVGPFDAQKLRRMPCIHTMSLIRREHFPAGGWDESIKKFQDWDLWLTMLRDGHIGFWINEVLFKIHPGGTISSWLPSFAYKLLPFLQQVKKYKRALEVIKKKHIPAGQSGELNNV